MRHRLGDYLRLLDRRRKSQAADTIDYVWTGDLVIGLDHLPETEAEAIAAMKRMCRKTPVPPDPQEDS
jgi:hypothetical protein